MIPDPEPLTILLEVRDQPIGSFERVFPTCRIVALAEEVIVRESPLRNRDRVVLKFDDPVVVDHGDTHSVVMPRIVSLLAKHHVVLAKSIGARTGVRFRGLVPEGELASSRSEISAENTPVVMPTRR